MTTRLFQLRRALVALAVIALLLLTVSSTFAHNAGHIILPDGRCINVGSLKDAPFVPATNPHQNVDGQLDLIPGPGDQYGARYAANQGSTPILPGEC